MDIMAATARIPKSILSNYAALYKMEETQKRRSRPAAERDVYRKHQSTMIELSGLECLKWTLKAQIVWINGAKTTQLVKNKWSARNIKSWLEPTSIKPTTKI